MFDHNLFKRRWMRDIERISNLKIYEYVHTHYNIDATDRELARYVRLHANQISDYIMSSLPQSYSYKYINTYGKHILVTLRPLRRDAVAAINRYIMARSVSVVEDDE